MFVFWFLVSIASAQIDYSASVGGRSKPLGGGIWGVAGYTQKLNYGTGYLQGYLRPKSFVYTSGSVSQAQVSLDLFPVAFAGVSLGYLASSRNIDFETFDCGIVECRDSVSSSFVETHLVLGHEKFFLLAENRFSRLTPAVKDRSFVDENSMLVGVGGGDELSSLNIFLGYTLDSKWQLGTRYGEEHMAKSLASNQHQSFFAKYKRDEEWSVVIGVGSYQSSTQEKTPTIYGVLKWTGKAFSGLID